MTEPADIDVIDTPPRQDLSVDQQLALRTAAARLGDAFADLYGPETIERFLHTSYDQFAMRSSVPHFLPLLAERFARQRLTALAKVEGKRDDGRPVVLFLCVHNAGRSQMALGFFQHLAGDAAVAMAERGIDIATEYPKPWTDEVVRAADVVVTMGCGDACPIFPGKRYLNWILDDPAGQTVEDVRPIRDEIERRVRGLLTELGVTAAA
jgi:arsenate reductase